MPSRKERIFKLACRHGKLNLVKTLHRQGVNINNPEYVNIALRYRRFNIMGYFIQQGIDIPNDRLPILFRRNRKASLAFLRKHKPTLYNDQEFEKACKNGDMHTINSLIATGDLDVDKAFLCACECGHLEVVMRLHDMGANVRYYDDAGVQTAAENGHVHVLTWLYEHGADIRTHDDVCLRLALFEQHAPVSIFIMQQFGIAKHIFERMLQSVTLETLKLMLNYIDDSEIDAHNCLLNSAQNKNYEVFKYLFENKFFMHEKFAPERISDDARSAINMVLAEHDAYELFEYFNAQFSSDVDMSVDECIAVRQRKININFIKHITRNKIPVINNQQSIESICRKSNFKVFKYLHTKGLNIKCKGNLYMRYAIRCHHLSLVDYLLRHGCKL